jgi:hypothetical protein
MLSGAGDTPENRLFDLLTPAQFNLHDRGSKKLTEIVTRSAKRRPSHNLAAQCGK